MRKTFENTAHFIVLAFVIIFIAVLSPVSSIKSNAQGENLEGLCTVDQNTTSTQFTIHYDVNDGSVDGKIKGTVKDATFPYYPQVKISSVILKATGYKFLGWAYEADAETPNFKAGETLNPDDNRLYELGDATVKDKITLYAVWESAASYTLNVYKEPKKKLTGETEHLSYSLLYGESVDLKGVFEKPDYVLNGFKDDKNKTYKVGELKNLTSKDGSVFNLYADWKAASYKIVYKDSLETLSGTFKNSNKTKSFTVETKTFALSKPSRTGYKFEGWEVSALDSKRKLDNEGSVVTSIEKGKYHQDIVLTAKWSFNARKVEYRIMVKEGNLVSDKTEALRNAFVNGNISTFTNSKTVTLKNPSIKGYSFKGWFNDPECTAKSANIKKSSTLSADPVVKYALFTENTYKIIVNGNNISGDKKVIAGIKYTDVLNTSDFATSAGIPWKYDSNSQLGLRFFSTKSNGKGTNFGASEDVTALTDKNNGTVTLYAVWDAYKITYVDSLADFGSSIMKNNTSNPGVFTPGTSAKNRYIKLVKPTKAGYTFISWECDKVGAVSVNGKGEYQIDRGMIDPCDITLTANWAPNTYTLYLYPNASDAELEVEGNYSSVSDSTKKGKCISLSVAYDGNTYTCNGAAISDLNEINYVRPGYTFKEWNTKSNGKGTAYSTGKALNLVSKTNSSAFLYAIWTKSAPDRVTGIRIGADNTLYFNEQNDVNGYEVQLGKKLTGVSRGTITEVASSGSTKVHGTSEKMYVRVRAYRMDSKGMKAYGAWSNSIGIKRNEIECDHEFDWIVTKAATCIKDGAEVEICKKCGEEGEIRAIDHESAPHAYVEVERTEPKCDEAGEIVYVCSVCDDYYYDSDALPALGHIYSEEKEVYAASCTEDGYEVYTCTGCGKKKTVYTDRALGHRKGTSVKEKVNPATCAEEGSYDEVTYCERCHEELSRKTVFEEALGHDYEWVVTKQGTAEEKGLIEHKCKRCGDVDDEIRSSHIHTYSVVVTKEPNCTEPGIRTYTCTAEDCDRPYDASYTEEIPALGHDYSGEYTVEKRPSCTETGLQVLKCVRCKAVIDEIITEKIAHKYEWVVTEATQEADGLREYKCKVCGDVSESEVIPKLSACSHPFPRRAVVISAGTCVDREIVDIYCNECGIKISENFIKNTNPDKHVGWTVAITKEPTYTESGIETYTCTGCGYSYQQTINPKTCYHAKTGIVQGEDGKNYKKCLNCGVILGEVTVTNVCKHTGYGKDEIVVTPTTETQWGEYQYACKHCHEVLETKRVHPYKTYNVIDQNGNPLTVYGWFDSEYEGEYYTEVFNQLNDYRAANGLNRLHYNTSLQYAANTRALEASFYFEHTRPNQERWNTVCPEWKYGGENIASGQSTPTNVMNAWKNSEGHNRNMLYGLESGQKPFAGVSIGVFHRYLFTSAVRPSIPNEVITWSQNFTFYEY